jgi:hypothetical protein
VSRDSSCLERFITARRAIATCARRAVPAGEAGAGARGAVGVRADPKWEYSWRTSKSLVTVEVGRARRTVMRMRHVTLRAHDRVAVKE